jgi:hypothetical protein
MTKVSTELAKFVSVFIEENGSDELIKMWQAEVKKEFVKLADKRIPSEEKKDKDAPKGAKNPYIFYCMDERAKVQAEYPELKPREVSKVLGEKWNEAKKDPEFLKRYQEKAEADKVRAATEKSAYVSKPSTPKKKTTRSKSGWDLFCAKNRDDVKKDGFTGHDIMRELGKRWTKLQEEETDMYEEYLEKAAELKATASVKVEDDE